MTGNDNYSVLMDTPLTELTYTVFDLETTGTSVVGGSEIIEIGAVRIEPGLRIRRNTTFQKLIKPEGNISESSIQIHGISVDSVSGSQTVCEVLYDFIDFSSGSVLVAHDAPKDMAFIRAVLREYGMSNPFDAVIDTLRMSRRLNPFAKFHNLDEIMERYHIRIQSPYQRHRALYDAEVTAIAFKNMMKVIGREYCFTLIELLEYLKKH